MVFSNKTQEIATLQRDGGIMYIITGKKENKKYHTKTKSLSRAMTIADKLIEDLYEGVKVEVFEGQLPIFEEGYYENR